MGRRGIERPYRESGHRGLDAAYESYADGIYDYCFWLTGDLDAATAATHNALIAALGCTGRLDDPATLRPWLYGVARNECLRAISPAPARHGNSARHAEGGRASRRSELPRRPGRVVAGLNSAEQEIAELSLRHRLTPLEIAAVVGRPMSAARKDVMRVYTTLVLKCGDNVVDRFTSPPAAPMPDYLHAELAESAGIRSRVAYHADRSKPHRRNGFPAPIDHSPMRIRPVPALLAATVLGSLLLVGAMSYRPTTQSSEAAVTPTSPPATANPDTRLNVGSPPPNSRPEGAPGSGVLPVTLPGSPTPTPTAPPSGTPSTPPTALPGPSTPVGCPTPTTPPNPFIPGIPSGGTDGSSRDDRDGGSRDGGRDGGNRDGGGRSSGGGGMYTNSIGDVTTAGPC